MSDVGSITRTETGGYVLRYERLFDKETSEVWAALTDPAILSRWLSRSEVELRVGGKFVIYFFDGRETMSGLIQKLEPGRLLEYTWIQDNGPQSLVRWTILPEGRVCRLILTHTLPAIAKAELIAELGGGWHAILGHLDAALGGGTGVSDGDRLRDLEARYADLFRQTEAGVRQQQTHWR